MEKEIFNLPPELAIWGEQQKTVEPKPIPISSIESIIDWLLSLPSVPLSLRQQFIAFWEMLPLGNYDREDVERLRIKFRGLLLDILMSIPDKEWNQLLKFEGIAQSEANLEMDLNTLFDMLEIAFHIQLTRGKKGFTAKLIAGHPIKEEDIAPKKFTLF